MLEINEIPRPAFTVKQGANPCGSHRWKFKKLREIHNGRTINFELAAMSPIYALHDKHPLKQDGRIKSTIQKVIIQWAQRPQTPFRADCRVVSIFPLKSECTYIPKFQEQQEIFIRNCGEFFVYFLPPTVTIFYDKNHYGGRYCGKTFNNTAKVFQREECKNYSPLTDLSHHIFSNTTFASTFFRCEDTALGSSWVRIKDANDSMVIAQQCEIRQNSSAKYQCGGLYHAWMMERHPVTEQVIYERLVCISNPNECSCRATSSIQVINCGEFYVYRKLQKFPLCGARVCTVYDPKVTTTAETTTQAITTQAETTPVTTTQATTTNFGNSSGSTESLSTTAVTNTSSNSELSTNEATGFTATTSKDTITTTTLTTEHTTTEQTTVSVKTMTPTNITDTTTTTQMQSTTSAPEVNLCQNYETIADETRMWSNNVLENRKCDRKFSKPVRFVALDEKPLKLKEGCSKENFPYASCQSNGLTWLEGGHPNKTDRAHERFVCLYTYPNRFVLPNDQECSCSTRQLILVQKCVVAQETFFVYKLSPLVASNLYCPARYCLEKQEDFDPVDEATTGPVTTPAADVIGSFNIESMLKIGNPFVNAVGLIQEDFMDPLSKLYRFLVKATHHKLTQMLASVEDVKSIKILKLRKGSIIVNYQLISDKAFNVTKLSEVVRKELERKPDVDYTDGEFTLKGRLENTSPQFQDMDECSVGICHKNALCTNIPSSFSYHCSCKSGYQGDGFTCDKVIHDKSHEWSNNAIVVVSLFFAIAFVVIVVLATLLCIKQVTPSSSYKTGMGKHGYDNYYDSKNIEGEEKNIRLQMYMSSDHSPEAARYDKVAAPMNYEMDRKAKDMATMQM